MKRVEVVGLIRSRIQLRVQQAGWQHGVKRVGAVRARVSGGSHVLVKRKVGVVHVVRAQGALRVDYVVLDWTLSRTGVV